MLTEVNKAAEANQTANRCFYEEVINQQKWAAFDEVIGPTMSVMDSLRDSLLIGRASNAPFAACTTRSLTDT